LVELRVVVNGLRFTGAKKSVGVPGIVRTAWQHISYHQAPYQRCEGCFDSRKMLFFVFSWNRNCPALALYRQAQGSWLLGA